MKSLEWRVQRLEDIESIKKLIATAGRWFDRAEMTASAEDAAKFYDTLFTQNGIMEFPFGTWGPERSQVIEELVKFSKSVDWSLHHYTNQEVELDETLESAIYHAIEIIPIKIDGAATWIFVENETFLKKIEGEWKIEKYGIIDFKSVGNVDDKWPTFEKNPKSWMFAKL